MKREALEAATLFSFHASRFTPHVFLMERAMGFEPHSVVSSALKPASLTPAEGASPLARSPRKGLTPFGIPAVVDSISISACLTFRE